MTVMGEEPITVGLPESTPALLSTKPEGSAPVSLQTSGASPLDAVKVKLYGRFTAPAEGGGVVLIAGGGGLLMSIL